MQKVNLIGNSPSKSISFKFIGNIISTEPAHSLLNSEHLANDLWFPLKAEKKAVKWVQYFNIHGLQFNWKSDFVYFTVCYEYEQRTPQTCSYNKWRTKKFEAENAFAMLLWKGVKIQSDEVHLHTLFNRIKFNAPQICLLRRISIDKWFFPSFKMFYGL